MSALDPLLAEIGALPPDAVPRAVALLAGLRDAIERLSALTGRERQVLALSAQGLRNKQIGQALGISPRTVEIHRLGARKRLGVRSSVEAARLYVLGGGT